MPTRRSVWAGLAAIALAATITAPATAHGPDRDLLSTYAATAGYHLTDRAADDGYGPFPGGPLAECIAMDVTGTDPSPAMGLHWVNLSLVDATLDAEHPEVLVYEPMKNGRLRLVGMEYVVFADAWEAAHPGETPSLFGRELTYVGAPNRYELPAFYQIHTWVWKHNPHGMFADHNPRVTCEHGW